MKKKAYAVIGLGRFGMPLAKKLAEAGKEVIGVDMDEERVKEFREFSEYAFVAKKLSKEVLSPGAVRATLNSYVMFPDMTDISVYASISALK